jgi:hypothetical protein
MVGGVVSFLVDDLGLTAGGFQEMGNPHRFSVWLARQEQ